MEELNKEELEIKTKQKQFLEKIEELSYSENPITPDDIHNFFENTNKELKRIFNEKLELDQKICEI